MSESSRNGANVEADGLSGSERPFRVLFTSTSYPQDASDWRGVFIAHISAALARSRKVALLQWAPPGCREPGVGDASTPFEAEWLADLMLRGGISHQLRTRPLTGLLSAGKLLRTLRTVYRRNGDIDLHHINWLQCAVPLPPDGKPALITVLGNDMRLLRLPGMRKMLRRALRGRAAAICPNADWMQPELERSFGDLALIRTVPFGINPCWYALERRFGEDEVRRWLCVSRITKEKLGSLFEWTGSTFSNDDSQLHLLGPMQEQIDLPPWVHWHGPVTPYDLCETWFPRAQGLITLSQHAEGRPQVLLEAMAAGLPIIASRLPAHDDLLGDGEGGILCATSDETRHALKDLANPRKNHALGQRGRARVRAEMGTWDDCAQRYIAIYRELLGASIT